MYYRKIKKRKIFAELLFCLCSKKVDKKLILKNTIPKGIEFLVTNYDDVFATQCRRPKIFQTMNSVRCKNPSLKYQRFNYTTRARDLKPSARAVIP